MNIVIPTLIALITVAAHKPTVFCVSFRNIAFILKRQLLTSDLLLQTEDDGHRLVQDQQLGLRFVALQVQLHHPAQLLERLVDVAHAQALPRVVGHPPLPLSLHLLLGGQVLVVVVAAVANGAAQEVGREGRE